MNIRFIRRKENIFNPDTIVEDGEKFADFEKVKSVALSYLSEDHTTLELYTLTLENGLVVYVDPSEWQLLSMESCGQSQEKSKEMPREENEEG